MTSFFDIPGGPELPTAGSPSAGGGGKWGSITGTLSNQTDLETELDAKLDLDGTVAMTGGLKLAVIAGSVAAAEVLFLDSETANHPSVKIGGTIFDLTDTDGFAEEAPGP